MPTKEENLMKTMFGTLKAAFAIAVIATVFAALGNAQCISVSKYKPSALMLRQPFSSGQFTPAAFTSAAYASVQDSQGSSQDPIVGFWYVKFTSDVAGQFFDWGYSQYHSDGTEILNSGTGARKFCLGVWKKAGPKYEVNHFAIAYDYATAPAFIGIVNIHETITVGGDHNSFTGTFTLGIYDQDGNLLEPPYGPGTVTGQIEGHRITVDTSIQDVLPVPPPAP
jgi:hypothetical protein